MKSNNNDKIEYDSTNPGCIVCNKYGHWTKDCPTNPSDDRMGLDDLLQTLKATFLDNGEFTGPQAHVMAKGCVADMERFVTKAVRREVVKELKSLNVTADPYFRLRVRQRLKELEQK